MKTWKRKWSRLLPILSLVPLAGCAIMSDLLAPTLPLQLGLDPATVTPQQGVVLVAFNNTTQFPATFYAFSSINAQDLTAGSRNFSKVVNAGNQQNEVIDCPVGVIAPGSLSASFQPQTLAATVAGTSGTTSVNAAVDYAGPQLVSGNAFQCGDMIEISLTSTGATATGGQSNFAISVRVVPGR
jgi:hypothetical protein